MDPPNLTDELLVEDPAPIFVGTYSHILKGSWRGLLVAIKVIRPLSVSLSSMRRKIRRESEVWSQMDHPNIVPFLALTSEGKLLGDLGALISPWYKNRDAGIFFQENGNSMHLWKRLKLWQGVVAGVCYLHAYSPVIVHGDLKPGNILIDDEENARICDFGLVHIFLEEGHSGHTTTSEHTGTDRYLAYELVKFRDANRVTTATDVWALGCIGLEFLYLDIPYKTHRNNRYGDIFQDIRNCIPPAVQPSDPSLGAPLLWDLLAHCWKLESSERATASFVRDSLLDFLGVQTSSPPVIPNSSSDDLQEASMYPRAGPSDPGPFQCSLCLQAFERQAQLIGHLETHSGGQPFVCDGSCESSSCRSGFTSPVALLLHKSSTTRLICEKCNDLVTNKDMSRHLREYCSSLQADRSSSSSLLLTGSIQAGAPAFSHSKDAFTRPTDGDMWQDTPIEDNDSFVTQWYDANSSPSRSTMKTFDADSGYPSHTVALERYGNSKEALDIEQIKANYKNRPSSLSGIHSRPVPDDLSLIDDTVTPIPEHISEHDGKAKAMPRKALAADNASVQSPLSSSVVSTTTELSTFTMVNSTPLSSRATAATPNRHLSASSQRSDKEFPRPPSVADSTIGGEGRGFSLKDLLGGGPKLDKRSDKRSEKDFSRPSSAAGSASGGEGRRFSLKELLRSGTKSDKDFSRPPSAAGSASGGEGRKFSLKELLSSGPKLTRRKSANSMAESTTGESATLGNKYGVYEKSSVGKGTTAIVKVAHRWDRTEDNLYAVKEFRPRRNKESQKEYVKKITSEFCISSALRHPNVVETLDLIQDEGGKWCEVMEFCPGGDLYSAIRKGGMSPAEVECCFKQVLTAVGYIHGQGVAHRDIKPQNLFFDAKGQIKIGDFGASTVFRLPWETTIQKSSGLCGAEPYIAPEQFTHPSSYDARLVDIWACGIVYYCLHFQELPWSCAQFSDKTYSQYALQCNSPGLSIAGTPFLMSAISSMSAHLIASPSSTTRQDTASITEIPTSNPYSKTLNVSSTLQTQAPSRIEREKEQIREAVAQYPATILDLSPRACRPVLRRMLEPNPELRVTVEDVLRHPWIMEIGLCTEPHIRPNHIHHAAIATADAGGIVADR